ncbi:MAG TPA: hypothetical protein DCE19_03160 [Gemmatimonadetes bacterium]|nr:hypothetical protein [Gemmatimonadota bacterium]
MPIGPSDLPEPERLDEAFTTCLDATLLSLAAAIHTARGTTLLGGSANLTRRNLGDYNLEVNLLARGSSALGAQVADYFERLWSNRDGHFSVSYEVYSDDSWVKRVILLGAGVRRPQLLLGSETTIV